MQMHITSDDLKAARPIVEGVRKLLVEERLVVRVEPRAGAEAGALLFIHTEGERYHIEVVGRAADDAEYVALAVHKTRDTWALRIVAEAKARSGIGPDRGLGTRSMFE